MQEEYAVITKRFAYGGLGLILAVRAPTIDGGYSTVLRQFFDSAEFGGDGGFPTAHELRCANYQAIMAGATRLWYFAYRIGSDLGGLLAELERIADEIVGMGGTSSV